jgi:hypothetical protein
MAGQNILRKLNAAKVGTPASGAGGTFRVPSLGEAASGAALLPVMANSGLRAVNTLIDPRTGLVPTLSNLARGIGNLAQGRPYLQGRVGMPSARLRDFGPGYRESELRAGAAAEAFRPGAGFPGQQVGSPAAERDYQQKVSRVAQLTAQDPELQRYEYARQQAKLAGPGSAAEQSAEDMGMQMWAKANPKLAAKVKPGQSGYDAIQRMQGAGQMGSPLNLPFDTSSPLGTTPPISPASYDAGKVAQGLGLSTVPRNAFAGASATPYSGFSQGPTLQSAPLGFPSEMPTASYAGATGIQPMGSAVDKFDPKGPEAQRLLEMFKDSIFTTQK